MVESPSNDLFTNTDLMLHGSGIFKSQEPMANIFVFRRLLKQGFTSVIRAGGLGVTTTASRVPKIGGFEG